MTTPRYNIIPAVLTATSCSAAFALLLLLLLQKSEAVPQCSAILCAC